MMLKFVISSATRTSMRDVKPALEAAGARYLARGGAHKQPLGTVGIEVSL